MSKTTKTNKNKGRRGRGKTGKLPENILRVGQFRPPMTVTVPTEIIGFADRMKVTLRYSDTYLASNSTPSAPSQVWRTNSCFDPDKTGTGHQPSFYDIFQLIYNYYFVEAFKLDLECDNYTTSRGAWGVCAYSDNDLSSQTVEQITEAKYAKSFQLGPPSGVPAKGVSMPWMRTNQLAGEPNPEPDPQMYTLITSNPGDVMYAYVRFISDDETANVNVGYRAILHQRVIFKDLNPSYASLFKKINETSKGKITILPRS